MDYNRKSLWKDSSGQLVRVEEFDLSNPLAFCDEFDLKQESIRLFGKEMLQPRLSALYGRSGTSYRYSGKTFVSKTWTGWLEELALKCSEICEVEFNTALLNYYRDGNDSMGLHADNEPELGRNPVIASVSFGVTRRMIFRKNTDKTKIVVDLNHGDLLIMRGALQHYWKHELPKQVRVEEPRLNVTFRKIIEN